MSEINCNNCAISDFKESLCKRCDKMKRIGSADEIEKLIIGCLPSEQPEWRWIPCSERLPEKKRKTYWVCTDTEYQCECRWTNNRFGLGESDNWGWSYFDTPQYTEVIAWMPLPEPYREEGEE